MRKINILTKNVYNRIAAGEVIDRPYSAVKELIENSLDAGADQIEIYIERGGKQLIKVVDNGSGIERDDMRAAFLPHATSKIATADDLDTIKTLGFRGEALASISVISKVELVSVTSGNSAYKVTCEDGKVGEILPAALEKGTEITVRNLFYNTPVRAKFMKPDKKEESDVTSFVTRYILGNPGVSFKYFVDGKLVLQSYGGGIDEAMAQVYGAKVLSECYKIKAEKDGLRISGFIGNQNFFKANKTYQSLFLNGRYIVNNTVATAISQAYASYTMKRQYPFYVLFVEVPADIVDVNVHPSKADVRFVDNKFIFGVIYSVISSVLDGTARAAEFVVDGSRIPEIYSTAESGNGNKIYSENTARNNGVQSVAEQPASPSVSAEEQTENELQKLIEKYKPQKAVQTEFIGAAVETERPSAPQTMSEAPAEEKKKFFNPTLDLPLDDFVLSSKRNVMSVSDNTVPPDFSKTAAYEIESGYFAAKQQKIEFECCKFKGNLFNTYLIYEYGDNVYLIDQHAAHERLIYDRLRKKLAERDIARQILLVPYIFETNPSETPFIESKVPLLRDMGFGISPFGGGAFRIDEVPVDLQEINVEKFFGEILERIDDFKEIKLEDILKEKIAMTACKHAIKGGMQLTEDEISALFKMLDGDTGLKCPHGRPVCITLDRKDIEKMFKRIV